MPRLGLTTRVVRCVLIPSQEYEFRELRIMSRSQIKSLEDKVECSNYDDSKLKRKESYSTVCAFPFNPSRRLASDCLLRVVNRSRQHVLSTRDGQVTVR